LLIGLAVVTGIAQACNLSEAELHSAGLQLKWPNDLLLNNHKFGGILIEGGQAKAGDPTWMIIGIGINLRNEKVLAENLGAELKVGSLAQLVNSPPDAEYLWLKLIASLEHSLAEFDCHGFKLCKERWAQWDAYQDQSVCISGAGKDPIYGIAKGVDETGALLLQQDNKTIAIHAGDVSLRIQP
jgi:BirA family biotin operon repressor/biotin-[acetyl-CoA-carboxylase] ligase